jgi:myosin-5
LEEKISNAESENQVLRQQALVASPTGKALTARPRTVILQVRKHAIGHIAQNYGYMKNGSR